MISISKRLDNRSIAVSRRALLGGAVGLAMSTRSGHALAEARVTTERTIERILGQMTLREKIGQMFIIQVQGTEMNPAYRDLLLAVQPGAVLFFGFNIGTSDQIRRYIQDIYRTGRYAPPMICVDQEGGPVTRVPGDPVPGATQLGQMPDRDVRRYAIDRAKFLREFGFNVNFAPVADVAYSSASSMVSRSFGSDPDLVSAKITAVVSGSRRGRVASAVKHFPGHGRTTVDSHFDLPVVEISLEDWLATDALPFQAAIDVGVEMVMFGHLLFPAWDSEPTTFSRVAVDTLRDTLGFRGVVITDDLVMGALMGHSPYDLVERSVAAGMDMVMYTSSPVPFVDLISHLEERVTSGVLSIQQIDASVRRILQLKTTWFPHLAVPIAG